LRERVTQYGRDTVTDRQRERVTQCVRERETDRQRQRNREMDSWKIKIGE